MMRVHGVVRGWKYPRPGLVARSAGRWRAALLVLLQVLLEVLLTRGLQALRWRGPVMEARGGGGRRRRLCLLGKAA